MTRLRAIERCRRFAPLAAAAIIGWACSTGTDRPEPHGFVTVRGTHFYLDESPFHVVGTNLWYGCYLGSPGSTGDRPRLLRELDALEANGIVNLRILAGSEDSYIRHSLKPAILRSPDVVDDSLLQGLDFLLDEMSKRRMTAVLFLTNYWEWSGGMSQYNVWTGREPVDPYDPAQGWPAFMDFSASFYNNADAVELNRKHIRSVVTRRNTVNGRLYNEDPTIMAWQLANEPRPGTKEGDGVKNLAAFYRWIHETAQFIRSLDPNHLISTGSEGTVGTLGSEDFFLQAHDSPSIDYLTFHLWPFNWGWYDPKRPDETMPRTRDHTLAFINQHLALVRRLNKPVVMDEFGLGRDNAAFLPGTPTSARDAFFQFVLQVLEDSVRAGSPFSGSNFWAWGGWGVAQHDDGMWKVGDPFLGDPPHEHQGLNSVFTSDTSTLRIIREHAAALKRVRESRLR
jgi:mannan endo-1,4-beta-mannosidase